MHGCFVCTSSSIFSSADSLIPLCYFCLTLLIHSFIFFFEINHHAVEFSISRTKVMVIVSQANCYFIFYLYIVCVFTSYLLVLGVLFLSLSFFFLFVFS